MKLFSLVLKCRELLFFLCLSKVGYVDIYIFCSEAVKYPDKTISSFFIHVG
jgi:hypothetical protein